MSDGTSGGTRLVKDIHAGAIGSNPHSLVALGDTLYFAADDGHGGVELWKSDGTEAGTVLVEDLRAGRLGASPGELTAADSRLFFTADDGTGATLWVSDGTEAGTRAVDAAVAGGEPLALTYTGGTLYYSANAEGRGREPYALSPAFFGDCTPPVLTCPADVEAVATGPGGAVVHYSPAQATDGASEVTLGYGTPSGATFPPGEHPVRVTASDAAGNTASCTFTVRVGAAPGGGPEDSGCGCTSGFAADAPWLLLGALVSLRARRRRASR
ncbi:ELWxxDGT repeat protein [Archangium violaceum]|uniref:ELWxxDGT repeat protein n=1 Tax=Archangium violaceum TaxID=83451 RepID=UPI001F30A5B0|nr:ELWxxDGT repeat protein [Archangium violaceum]